MAVEVQKLNLENSLKPQFIGKKPSFPHECYSESLKKQNRKRFDKKREMLILLKKIIQKYLMN